MPGHPFTHEHRRHAISNCDRDPEHVHDIDSDCILDESADDDQRVTVADLLDAYDKWAALNDLSDTPEWDAYQALCARATYGQYGSLERILSAERARTIAAERLAALSPEERAEFDRRTTG